MTLMRNDVVTFEISFDISNNFLKGFSKENWNEMSSDISKDIKRDTGNTCKFWLNYIIFSISNNKKYNFFHCEVYAACINKQRMILSFQKHGKIWQFLLTRQRTTSFLQKVLLEGLMRLIGIKQRYWSFSFNEKSKPTSKLRHLFFLLRGGNDVSTWCLFIVLTCTLKRSLFFIYKSRVFSIHLSEIKLL